MPAFVDFHNHLLPGVDDGSRTLEEGLEGLEKLSSAGISRIVTTPHFRGSLTTDRRSLAGRLGELDDAWLALRRATGERWPALELMRGAEVLLDDPSIAFKDPRTRLAGTAFVLVEWPGFRVPPRSSEVLARIVDQGYRPVVAHPERYGGQQLELRTVAEWRSVGALLQTNAGSLVGMYGKGIQRAAEDLLRAGLVDYLCTDFHGRTGYALHFEGAKARFERAGASEAFSHLASVNPGRLLDGEEPLPLPPISLESGLWDRIRGMVQSREA